MLITSPSNWSVARKRRSFVFALFFGALLIPALPIGAALVVPTDIELPGTQPGEVGNLETASNCDGCHGDRGAGVEIAHEWRGSMMAHAGRDPIFWATMAIAEQDFDGSGDLCLRCHATAGWLAGRSTPTDASGLQAGDDDGVECGYCHTLTNPDDSDPLLIGEQFPPYVANCSDDLIAPSGTCQSAAEGYYGSGMASLWNGNQKLGPYTDAAPKHQFEASSFHRSVDFCGTCHDVSNSVTGDLAHNGGVQDTADLPVASGVPGGPVADKAAFNNPAYAYGIVERTFSESKSGMLIETRVGDYGTLPVDIQDGAIAEAYTRSIVAGTGGDYEDGTPRYFSCQTCHMAPTTGLGCNKNGVPVRNDLPTHDMTGGNYWMPAVIQYQDAQGELVFGGGLSAEEIAGLDAGALRAKHNLENAAAIDATTAPPYSLRITNLTGHKLISGYPEGRRMWINVKWYDGQPTPTMLREDGAYGPLEDEFGNPVEVVNPADGQPVQVQSILDLADPETRIYEVHMALTQEWATQLLGLGYPAGLPLGFDRYTGAVEHTLGDLGAEEPGSYEESFHFVLNNKVAAEGTNMPDGGFAPVFDRSACTRRFPAQVRVVNPESKLGSRNHRSSSFSPLDHTRLRVSRGRLGSRPFAMKPCYTSESSVRANSARSEIGVSARDRRWNCRLRDLGRQPDLLERNPRGAASRTSIVAGGVGGAHLASRPRRAAPLWRASSTRLPTQNAGDLRRGRLSSGPQLGAVSLVCHQRSYRRGESRVLHQSSDERCAGRGDLARAVESRNADRGVDCGTRRWRHDVRRRTNSLDCAEPRGQFCTLRLVEKAARCSPAARGSVDRSSDGSRSRQPVFDGLDRTEPERRGRIWRTLGADTLERRDHRRAVAAIWHRRAAHPTLDRWNASVSRADDSTDPWHLSVRRICVGRRNVRFRVRLARPGHIRV
jgi:hypothetical protein